MITIETRHNSMRRCKTIKENGVEIGTVIRDTKNLAYVHQGKFIVWSNHHMALERFHKLSSAIRFCLGYKPV